MDDNLIADAIQSGADIGYRYALKIAKVAAANGLDPIELMEIQYTKDKAEAEDKKSGK